MGAGIYINSRYVLSASKFNSVNTRSVARIDLSSDEKIRWFKFSDCRVNLVKRQKESEKKQEIEKERLKNEKLPKWFWRPEWEWFKEQTKEEKQKYLEQEIQTCEMWYAFQNGCDLLADDTRINKCEDLKSFIEKQAEAKKAQQFRSERYVD